MKARKLSTKYWQWMALVAILALVLAACGGGAVETPAVTEEPTPVPPTQTPVPPPPAITVLQSFETDAVPYDGNGATASLSADEVFTGTQSLKSESAEGEWHTVGVNLGDGPVDLTPYSQLCFYVFDTTAMNNGRAANTVGVKLFDASGASVERYSDNEGVGANPKTRQNEWTMLCMNTISFTGIDQTQVTNLEFTMYWAGVYYFDEITGVPAGMELAKPEPPAGGETMVLDLQGFEADGTFYSDYQAEVSLATDIVHGGASSLMATYPEGEWHAFGAYPDPRPVDLSAYTQLCFWFYDTTPGDTGNGDNTIGVKLFDPSGANEEVWTDNELAGENPKTTINQWVQMCMNLDAYTSVDLTQIDKIQFAFFWAGTYYVDDVQAIGTTAAPVSVVVQDFEAEDTFYSDYQAEVSLATDIVHGGASSLMATYPEGEWHAFGGYPNPRPIDMSSARQLCFWFYDTTPGDTGNGDNTIGVKLFDPSGANEEVWTDNELAGENPKTTINQWVQMCMNLDAYTSVDLTQIDMIQFAFFWAGTYYVDDITLEGAAGYKPPVVEEPAPEPLGIPVVSDLQGFEAEETFYSDYQADVSLATDIVHGGTSSLMATYPDGEWHAFGAYPAPRPLDLSGASQVCFWIYDTTANNSGLADNSVGVKLFDAAGNNEEVWTDADTAGTNPKTVTNEWVQMCVNLSAYSAVDLTQVDKVQFALYWAGTYYVDDVTFVTKIPAVARSVNVQGFEAEETFYTDYQAEVSLVTSTVHSGATALMATYPDGEWHAFGGYPEPRPLDLSGASQLCFWINDTTTNNSGLADNSVGVKLFDASGANAEVWTDSDTAGTNPKTVTNEWVQMCMNLSAYTGIDLSQIDKIQFALYWAGTYYVDDITAVVLVPAATEPVVAQDFETEDTYYTDYQADVSLATDIFHGGAASLMATYDSGEWHAFGAYPSTRPFDANTYGRVCFWIYDTTTNNSGLADNSVGVKLFDASGASAEVWTDNEAAGTNPKTVTNEWVQMCMTLSAYSGIDLSQLDKIQFALYWAGTYYVDDITFEP